MINPISDLLHEQFELQPHLMSLMSFKRQSSAKETPLLYLLCGALTCGLLGHPLIFPRIYSTWILAHRGFPNENLEVTL